jgi:hypothetical protein
MSRQERLGLLPAVPLDDRFVLTRVANALVANLADIDRIAEHSVEGASVEPAACGRSHQTRYSVN